MSVPGRDPDWSHCSTEDIQDVIPDRKLHGNGDKMRERCLYEKSCFDFFLFVWAWRPGVLKPFFLRGGCFVTRVADLLCRPFSPANRRCHIHRMPDLADLSWVWRWFGIFDAVEAPPRNMEKVAFSAEGMIPICCADRSPR